MSEKAVLIIGASRGIGLGLVREYVSRGYRVIASERSRSDDLHALAEEHGERITIVSCDVTEPETYTAIAASFPANSIDHLILNAGIYGSKNRADQALPVLEREEMADMIMANATGPIHTALALLPLVKDGGRIGMLTSKMGSIDDSSGGANFYRVSKVAQNMLARSLFEEHARARGIPVLSLHPGWVQTDMGGPNALVTVAESAAGLVDRLEEDRAPEHVFIDYSGAAIGW